MPLQQDVLHPDFASLLHIRHLEYKSTDMEGVSPLSRCGFLYAGFRPLAAGTGHHVRYGGESRHPGALPKTHVSTSKGMKSKKIGDRYDPEN
jgi:hypothetical protein